jgi:hypothetical protein
VLTLPQLIDLERSLRGERVLNVYVGGRASDPAARAEWRIRLDDELRATRDSLGDAPRGEREGFDRAVAHLRERLPEGSAPGARGWVAFVTADGVRYAEELPVPMPAHVAWTTGMYVAPYVRALKQLRPVLVAVVNSEEARLHRYRAGTLEALDSVRAVRHGGAVYHMGDAPRQGFHPGTRGATGTDEAERRRLEAIHHLASTTADRLTALAGDDGWIVLGGTPEPLGILRAALPERVNERVLTVPTLHDGASEAEVARAAEAGASVLRNAHDLALIEQVLERRGVRGLGAAGVDATRRALAGRAVQELFLSHRFLDEHADEADAMVRAALDQGAVVEEVSGAAAERLDHDGDGIAARLRFAPPAGEVPLSAPP